MLPVEAYRIGGVDIGLSWRSDNHADDTESDTIYLIRNNLITESDQDVDLTSEEKKRAFQETIAHWKPTNRSKNQPTEASPVWIRKCRNKKNGLLLIYVFKSGKSENNVRTAHEDIYLGYAISFPGSDTATPVEYKVDEVYLRNDFDEE